MRSELLRQQGNILHTFYGDRMTAKQIMREVVSLYRLAVVGLLDAEQMKLYAALRAAVEPVPETKRAA